jgi:hypothetical protein
VTDQRTVRINKITSVNNAQISLHCGHLSDYFEEHDTPLRGRLAAVLTIMAISGSTAARERCEPVTNVILPSPVW